MPGGGGGGGGGRGGGAACLLTPDGTHVVFTSARTGQNHLYVVSLTKPFTEDEHDPLVRERKSARNGERRPADAVDAVVAVAAVAAVGGGGRRGRAIRTQTARFHRCRSKSMRLAS